MSRLVGFAYVHMAYDLPCVIARWLPWFVGNNEFDTLQPFLDVPQDRRVTEADRLSEIWRVFIKADLTLVGIFGEFISSSDLLPVPTRLLVSIMPRDLQLLPGLWVVLQRHEAWHNAEKLASSAEETAIRLKTSLGDQVAAMVNAAYAEPLDFPVAAVRAANLLQRLSPPLLPAAAVIRKPLVKEVDPFGIAT